VAQSVEDQITGNDMATIQPATTIVQESGAQFRYTFVWADMAAGDVGALIGVSNAMQGVDHSLTFKCAGPENSQLQQIYRHSRAGIHSTAHNRHRRRYFDYCDLDCEISLQMIHRAPSTAAHDIVIQRGHGCCSPIAFLAGSEPHNRSDGKLVRESPSDYI
jgi:hypothetical protein